MKLTARPYQIEAVNSVWNYFATEKGNPIVAMPTGCHAKGHKILMFNGSLKCVEDIQIGDLLMGPDSKPREVLCLARGRQEMRRIIPNKGESFVVNLDHKLSVKKVKQGGDFVCRQEGIETITVREYENGSNWYKHVRKLRRCKVDFNSQPVPLDPYFMAAILGDGSLKYGTVTFTSMDKELIEYMQSIVIDEGCKFNKLSDMQFSITDNLANRSTPNRIMKKFRDLGLNNVGSYTVFIPEVYKVNTEEVRYQVLAALIDTDGYYDKNGNCYEHCTVSEQLSNDVRFICRSLGLAAYTKKCKAVLNGKEIGDAFRTYISGDIINIPVKLPRKKARIRSQIKDVLCTGFKTETLPEDDYYGFTLSGDHLYLDENFIVHHNTGKSLVIAYLIKSIFYNYPNQKVIMVTHVMELIEQNYSKLMTIWPTAPAGVYSAGLGQRDLMSKIIFAGIASIAKQWAQLGKVDIIIIDECHLVSPEQETTYRMLIQNLKEVNPFLKVIGFTATPYRLGHGSIIENGGIFTDICFDICGMIPFNRLIAEGYLAPLIPKNTETMLDVDGVKLRGGEFIASELQTAVNKADITAKALKEAMEIGYERKSWLIFASGVEHAIAINEMLNSMGIECGVVHGKLSKADRKNTIDSFKRGELRAIVNNNILTTGFDNPEIDLIVVLRPTCSPVLWVQMLGRGTRPCDGKENCLVLDFAGNTKRLGPINDPVIPRKKGEGVGDAPVRLCDAIVEKEGKREKCNTWNHASVRKCVECGNEFKFETKLNLSASTKELIKGDMPVVEVFKVDHITYSKHQKQDKPPCMRVNYYCGLRCFTEYVHVEANVEYIRRKASKWWQERSSTPIPNTVDVALEVVKVLKSPTHLRVWVNKKYPEIMLYCYDGTAFNTQEKDNYVPPAQADIPMIMQPGSYANFKSKDEDLPFDNSPSNTQVVDIDDDLPF